MRRQSPPRKSTWINDIKILPGILPGQGEYDRCETIKLGLCIVWRAITLNDFCMNLAGQNSRVLNLDKRWLLISSHSIRLNNLYSEHVSWLLPTTQWCIIYDPFFDSNASYEMRGMRFLFQLIAFGTATVGLTKGSNQLDQDVHEVNMIACLRLKTRLLHQETHTLKIKRDMLL